MLYDKSRKALVAYPGAGKGAYSIPEGTQSIGDRSFSYCSGITSLTIPDSVPYIDDKAFSGCSGLTNLTIPDSMTYIGYEAFSGYSNIVLSVVEGSYAELYAKDHGIKYNWINDTSWLFN